MKEMQFNLHLFLVFFSSCGKYMTPFSAKAVIGTTDKIIASESTILIMRLKLPFNFDMVFDPPCNLSDSSNIYLPAEKELSLFSAFVI